MIFLKKNKNIIPDDLLNLNSLFENPIQNLNEDICGTNYVLNMNINNNHFYNNLISKYSAMARYSHKIIGSVLVLNFYSYLYLCKSNHINNYTTEDYVKLFNLFTYKINSQLFSNKKYLHVNYSIDFIRSLDRTSISNSYLFGTYLLDHKYNNPVIDIIKYIYLFAQAYSEHEGIEDENLHYCIDSIENILTSKMYDYSNVTIEIINILSKHNIYCKLIYDTEKNEYENMDDISSKFIKYYGFSFIPIYKNKSMITEETLVHIFGYDFVNLLKGCDDEYIALFPLQTISIS